MFNLLAMTETQLAAIALGTVVLLSCSGAWLENMPGSRTLTASKLARSLKGNKSREDGKKPIKPV